MLVRKQDHAVIRRYGHERGEIGELTERLETAPMEPPLHIGHRVLMFREPEEGWFF